MSKRAAFTLAEVLITLGILGVVAAITMPTLVTSMTERKNSERHANIANKVTQAMEHMRATGKLVQYDSTEAFVNELKKHLKITKICDKDHLTECWPTETVTNRAGEEYNVADAKTGKELGLESETNNVGLILGDGAILILNYNPALTQGLDVGDRVVASNKNLPVGNGKMKNFAYTSTVTGPIDFIMDVNGKAKPNREPESDSKQFDIRSLKAATFTTTATPFVCTGQTGSKGCVKYLGNISAVSCSSTSEYYTNKEICGDHPSGYANDYWAGAKAACNAIAGMHLPTEQELKDIQAVRSEYHTILSTSNFWSSDEDSSDQQHYSRFVTFSNGSANGVNKYMNNAVLCVGD